MFLTWQKNLVGRVGNKGMVAKVQLSIGGQARIRWAVLGEDTEAPL